jgi:hypothetical protein
MALMCTGCYKQTDYYFIALNEKYHAYTVGNCKKCGENVAEVDDMIIDTIILLNKKGYKTKFCCSGHLNENHFGTYIMFINRPDILPEGFYPTDMECMHLHSTRNPKGYEGFKKLLEINLNLYKWANELPDLSEE